MKIGSLVHVIIANDSLHIIEATLITRNKTHSDVQINDILVEQLPNHFIFKIPLFRRILNKVEKWCLA